MVVYISFLSTLTQFGIHAYLHSVTLFTESGSVRYLIVRVSATQSNIHSVVFLLSSSLASLSSSKIVVYA
jgi:hypothetical protein